MKTTVGTFSKYTLHIYNDFTVFEKYFIGLVEMAASDNFWIANFTQQGKAWFEHICISWI